MNGLSYFGRMKAWAGSWTGDWWTDKRIWSAGHFGGRKTVSSEVVSEDSALNYSAVWCATRLLCGTASSLPLPLYKGLDEDRREKARSHPVYRALNVQPNPEMTAVAFRSIMWQWQVNWGNAYAEIEREGDVQEGELRNLWPIHPSRVRLERTEDRELVYVVKNSPGEEDSVLYSWQMLHVCSIVTKDGICGDGVIEHARESIGMGIATEKYGANWFGGGAVPRIVIEHEGKWDPDQRKNFRDEWAEIYSDPTGSRVAVLGGKATAKPINISAEDSQFLQTRQHNVEEIARWYGVPPHMLQHLLRATFSNIEHLGIEFVQYSLIPWMRNWEQEVNRKLLTPDEQDEYFVEHNVDALLRGDFASRMAGYNTAISIGIMRRNEARIKENMDPVDGGDTFLVQGAMVPLDGDGRPISNFVDSPVNAASTDEHDSNEPPQKQQNEAISLRIKRMLKQDLNRILTKEGRSMITSAKRDGGFVARVDEFYTAHTVFLNDNISEHLGALRECGLKCDLAMFVATWIQEGKSAILEAAGTASPRNLQEIVQNMVDSRAWNDRPIRAIEGLCNATDLM